MRDDELRRLFPDLPAVFGSFGRDRIFTLETTFFLFLWQVLSMSSCVAAVQRVLLRFALAGEGAASPSSSAYCQARVKIPSDMLDKMLSSTVVGLEAKADCKHLWKGRRVMVVDGTTVSMPDTKSCS
jgi:hypothetical protein